MTDTGNSAIGESGLEAQALTRFTSFLKRRPDEPGWLHDLRQEAMARFASAGLPTSRDEEWKYTDVRWMGRTSLVTAGDGETLAADAGGKGAAGATGTSSKESMAELCRSLSLSDGHARLVFVDGRHAPQLSSLAGLPAGITAVDLEAACQSHPDRIRPHLEGWQAPDGQRFGDWNAAFMQGGAVVHLPAGKVVNEPLHILYLSSGLAAMAQQDAAVVPVTHPRTLILADAGSQATVVEEYAGPGEGVLLTNAVTTVALGDGAVIEHVKIEGESPAGSHIALMQVRQGRNSNFSTSSFTTRGLVVRNDVHVLLEGEGADCGLYGLYVTGGSRHVDSYTAIDHAVPHCSSRELYKGILGERSRGIFFGRILVRPDAQKTSAWQTNKNLLLSAEALANSTPQLEIYADDVQCRHGSTIGQLDDDMLFYLRSRGIPRQEAEQVLTYAFASEILERVRVDSLRHRLQRSLFGATTEAAA